MFKSKGLLESGRILYIPAGQIRPNPGQPRKVFDPMGLQELAESISRYGILQPLTVRRRGNGYELVAGERRLRAAKLAGLQEVPCILLLVDEEQSGMVALVENLQRRDLDYIEEAQGLARLMRLYGLNQEEAAARVGKSQSAVANKLRLLRHSPEVLEFLREHRLSERHARALLRLPNEAERLAALAVIIKQNLNVAKTEEYIDALLKKPEPPVRQGTRKLIVRDVRLFINSVNHNLDLIRGAGIRADATQEETETEIVLTIRLPKRAG
ncbi:MAG: ParB/RepB/Spo0J family partition protein [Oscillospiraceae bacterium]|jgi:ParB family chromosome partitioning protein|nr:ParB/RepB/Spo0J family partition protein [Oscillospiraceae bacterium]